MMLDIKIHASFGHITIGIYVIYRRCINLSLSRCPCGVRRRPESARLLGSRVRIPLKACMFVSCVLCCVVSGLCNELIALSEESYQVCVCVCVRVSNCL
jgi:hypothetical protein